VQRRKRECDGREQRLIADWTKTLQQAERELEVCRRGGLAVVAKHVVHDEPADRRLSGEGGVWAVHIAAGQRGGPLS
jgi:hypothetical protein